MDQITSHENSLILNTAKKFLEDEIYPHEETVDKIGEVPIELGKQIEKRAKATTKTEPKPITTPKQQKLAITQGSDPLSSSPSCSSTTAPPTKPPNGNIRHPPPY